MTKQWLNWLRTLGAPEDPTATDTSSEWSAMSLLKAIYAALATGALGERNVRVVTAAGAVTVNAETDSIIIINKTVGEATTVNMPSAAARSQPIKVVDGKLDAGTNNITIAPAGIQTVVGLSTYVIAFNGGSVDLWPLPDGTGWYI